MTPEQRDLRPLPYHGEVVSFLREEETAIWDWYASEASRARHAERLRTSLLESCYRLDEVAHPEIANASRTARERLGLTAVPLTLYQAQGDPRDNAAMVSLPGECHVVFSGGLLGLLEPDELVAVIGHELAHHRLYQEDDGAHLVAGRVIDAIREHRDASFAHLECARRLSLVTEVYADRGALLACGSLPTAVAALVKCATGFARVRGDSYLAQAREVLSKREKPGSPETSHPETFLRARSLELWSEQGAAADAETERLVHGDAGVTSLDLVGQRRWTRLTRRLVAELLRPEKLRSETTHAHARHFFPDIAPAREVDPSLDADLRALGSSAAEYLAYLLLDFAAVDPDLADEALPEALARSRRLGIERAFEAIARKELAIRAPRWKDIVRRADPLAPAGGSTA